jgi:DNA-binding XRE family transcriptional regulator
MQTVDHVPHQSRRMHDDPDDARRDRRRRELGGRVRSLRLWRDLPQDALAYRVGIARSTLQLIEYGDSAPTADMLWELSDVLQVPVTWFLSDDWTWPAEWRGDGGQPPEAPPVRRS